MRSHASAGQKRAVHRYPEPITTGIALRSRCLPEAVRPFRRPEQKSTDCIASPDAARRIADVLRDIPLFAQLLDPLTGPIPSPDGMHPRRGEDSGEQHVDRAGSTSQDPLL